jgi:5'(3')-deoxyribonucleotidase
MSAEDQVALIDLDGTVADYDGEMARGMRDLKSPGEPDFPGWDDVPNHIEARRNLIKRQPGFWRGLPRLELGFHVVEELRALGFMLHVLTKGPKATTSAWTEKVEWSREHLPDAFVTVTQDKSLVYGKIFVDDFPPYFEAWLTVRPRGLVVCVAHDWNGEYTKGGTKEHPNVFRYNGANREELRQALQRAYVRKAREESAFH